ncbi:MAG: acyltransferase [Acidimicrobiia bacterium]|nr:acyltransferase [Acidimicrobiia bacterium]
MTTGATSPTREPMTAGTRSSERRRDLDLLRMLVVVGLVFFHSARVFDTGSFYVKNDPTSEAVTIALFFMALWGMPLLFVIAGTGMWYSLRSRSAGQFARERVRRLLVPLIFGVVVIVPPQVWTRLRGDAGYAESFWEFLPRFFDVEFTMRSFPFVVWGDPATGLFETGHLWFVVVLFAYSLLLLPMIRLLRRPSGLRMIDRVAESVDRWWVLLLAGIPFAALDVVFGSEEGLAGWSRYSYATFILYGYLLATDRRFRRALQRFRTRNLVLGVALFGVAGVFYNVASNSPGVDPLADFDLASLGLRSVKGLSGWLTLAAILGFAGGSTQTRLPRPEPKAAPTLVSRVTAYTAEAVLPIYVLHQTVIVLLAYYVVQWQIPSVARYLVISLVSLIVILAIYDVAVRRTRLTRFVFGMKPPERDRSGRGLIRS